MEVLNHKVYKLSKAIAEGENNKLELFIYYSHCPNVALPLCEYFVFLLSQIGPKTRFFLLLSIVLLLTVSGSKGLMLGCVSRYFTDFRKNCAQNQKSLERVLSTIPGTAARSICLDWRLPCNLATVWSTSHSIYRHATNLYVRRILARPYASASPLSLYRSLKLWIKAGSDLWTAQTRHSRASHRVSLGLWIFISGASSTAWISMSFSAFLDEQWKVFHIVRSVPKALWTSRWSLAAWAAASCSYGIGSEQTKHLDCDIVFVCALRFCSQT